MPSLIFPSVGVQLLSSLVFFVGVTVLTHCLSRRALAEDLTTWKFPSRIPWPRLCILLIFLDSWLFLFSSGVLTFGVGLETHRKICAVAIYICVFFYSTSKFLIYCFLIEKVHLVWSPVGGVRRFQSKIYILCTITVGLYSVAIAVMVIGDVGFLREDDRVCIIGLKPYSSIFLLAYDLYITIFLTALFLWPIVRSSLANPRVKMVAIRTLIAAVVALTTSIVNMAVLTFFRGHELGWVCLCSCGADVIVNAVALFWVTSGPLSKPVGSATGPTDPRRPAEMRARASSVVVVGNNPPVKSPQTSFNDRRPSISVDLPSTPAAIMPFNTTFSHPAFGETCVSRPSQLPQSLFKSASSVMPATSPKFSESHELQV
ncbi:uncharacterized protein BT62DRAFT_882719 [Guyanagaster necrorhizus]|uniref:Transmembrane protein n=1 Tax=Guyanagaster necrorhizus TaxID=856835 RepID=A0A9P8AYU8_9AGAR|nr:uncharacterized protein BT62DRAFT_882719 [Guyanagaster necrorhizus MCA 3950]KAG7451297.1 hypothetical protein BT62DRAFT_882719 [Guyanagaster necrorhizus MCA 3950]